MAKELTHRADELKALGWSTDDVSRYAELWDYRQRWGAINLERDDRQFLKKAESALPKILSGKAAAKKPISEKSYYRWLNFYLSAMNDAEKQLHIPNGSRGAWPILIEEELRALDYYQPVLGLPDTIKARHLELVREEIIKNSSSNLSNGFEVHNFDFHAPIEELKQREKTSWRFLREGGASEDSSYPVFNSSVVSDFRSQVRKELIPLICSTFPSLDNTDKPQPPDDWSPE